ncbi:MAG TPA: SDR family oxidoreductase [Acetobacteraceae bacterium]|nr:SDR family oxidoreductase [Acetobacteraceae bacterium]
MAKLEGRVAWVTGAGSGIGEAASLALAAEGARLILTGRRKAPLEALATRIRAANGVAEVEPADLMDKEAVARIGAAIGERFGRLDILVNNAGGNILERDWKRLTPAGIDQVIGANLSAAFYCVTVALPFMRAQKDGVLIHTASFAGRFVHPLSGAAYTATKHGVVAMSHSINMEECVNGIRSTAICPGEVATPILDKRPVPVSAEDRARMLQPEDCADLILYVACLPPHVCINEVLITPTWNRAYVASTPRG